MEMNEILSFIQTGGAEIRKAEQALTAQYGESADSFADFLNELIESAISAGAQDNLLRTLDSAFRRNKGNQGFAEVLAKAVGDLYKENLNDVNRAEYYYRFLKGNEKFAQEVRDFYVSFYSARGSWTRLEQFLEDEATATDRPKVEVYRELGRIAEDAGNQAKAVSYWQNVLKLDPEDNEAAGKMEELYEAAGKWHSLVDMLLSKVKRLPEDAIDEKIGLLKRAVQIYRDKMNAVTKVISTYQAILDIDPRNVEAMDDLLSVYSGMNRWPDAAKILKRKISITEDPDVKTELLESHADLMETRFSNVAEAIKDYEEILQIKPGDQDVMIKLKALYEKRRDYEKYVQISLNLLDFEEDPEARLQALRELAKMATTQVRKVQIGVDLWNRVLEMDPEDIQALTNLEDLYRRLKDYAALAKVIERKIELMDDPVKRRMELEKLAHMYGAQVHDPDAATNTWLRVLELDPSNERAKREIRNRYQASKQWDELEAFLRKYATVNELAVTLESHIKDMDDPEQKKRMLINLAKVWRDEIGQPLKAIKDFEAVLGMDPLNRDAVFALIELYKEAGQWKKLPTVYDAALEGEADKEKRRDLMVEAAKIQEEKLHKKEMAFFGYIQALRENPLDTWLREQAERLAGPTGNWEAYVEALEDGTDAFTDDADKVREWHHIGEIYWEKVGNSDAAIRVYKEILNLDPMDIRAMDALEQIYISTEKFADLVDILARKLEIQSDDSAKIVLLRRIAELRYQKLDDTDGAIQAYKGILELNHLDIEAFQGLNRIYVSAHRMDDLRDLLEEELLVYQEVPGVRSDFLAELNLRLGMLTYGTGKDPLHAVEYFGHCLDSETFRAQAIENLESLISLKELRPRVIGLLKGAYETLERYEDLADLYEIELQDKGASIDTLDLMWKLVELYQGPAKNDFKVYRTLTKLLEVNPDDHRIWDELKATARSLDNMEDVAQRFEAAITKLEDVETRIALTLIVAEICFRDLHDIERAKKLYNQVLEDDDASLPALTALEEILETTQNWGELLEIYQRRYELAVQTQEKIDYAFKMSEVYFERLEDTDGAITAARLVLDLDPDNIRAYKTLDNLYSLSENQEELEKTLLELVRLSDDVTDRIFLRLRIADIREGFLNDLIGAMDMYSDIIEEDIDNEQARVNLERLFQHEDLQNRIAEVLLPVYKRHEDYENQVKVYEVLVAHEVDNSEKVRYYEILRDLCEINLDAPERAFAFAAEAYKLEPDDSELTEQLVRLGDKASLYKQTVDVLCEKVFDIDDDDRRMQTHKLIAHLCLEHEVDRELAKTHLREVLKLNPEDIETLDILIQTSAEDEEHENLVKYLRQKAEVVFDPVEKESILLEAGRVIRYNIEDADRAIEVFRLALDTNPQSFVAIESLEELYQGTGKWEDLVSILDDKARAIDDMEVRLTALKKMAVVKHDELNDTEGAVDTLNEAIALAPNDMEALNLLDEYYIQLEDYSSLYDVLKRKLDVLEGEDKLTIFLRIGAVQFDELSDSAGALETYKQALDEFPNSEEIIERMETMIHKDEMAAEAFDILRDTLSANGQWERLLVLYNLMAEREVDPQKKVTYYTTIGEIARDNMNEPTRAFDSFSKAFVLAPLNDDLLQVLYELTEQTELWESLAEVLKSAIEQLGGGNRAIELNMKAAAIYRDKVENLDSTVACLEEVIDVSPDNKEALTQLEELYDLMDRPSDLARILQNRIDIESDPSVRVEYYLKLSDVQKEKLGNLVAAFEACTESMYIVPGNIEAVQRLRVLMEEGFKRQDILEILEPVYTEMEDYTSLVSLYRLRLEDELETGDRKEILLKTADVLTTKLEEFEEGMLTYGEALKLDPEDDFLVDKLHELADLTGDKSLLVNILVSAADTDDDERKIYLWMKAALVSEDVERKEEIYRWVIELEPTNKEALAALDDLMESQERWKDLEEILKLEIDAADFDDDKIRFLYRLGVLRAERLGSPQGAIEVLEEAVSLDESRRDVLDKLAEVHEQMGNNEALFRVFGQISDIAIDTEDRMNVLRRMALIAEEDLEEAAKAIELWEEVNANQPDDMDVLHRLQTLYIGEEDWGNLVSAYQREIDSTEDADRLFDLHKLMAQTAQEALDDDFLAEQHWLKALELQANDRESLDNLANLYRKNEDFDKLVSLLERMVLSGVYDQDESLQLQIERARLLTFEVPRTEDAIVQWLEVLDSQPENREALEALQDLYEQNGQFAEAVGVLERLAELTEEQQEQVVLLNKAAEMSAQQVGDPAHAGELYAKILQIDPKNIEVYERYEVLLRAGENWDSLTELLLKKVEVLEEDEDKVAVLYELSSVYENQMGKPELALLIYQKSLTLNPENENALEEMWRLAQITGMWEEYVDFIEEIQDRLSEDSLIEQLLRAASVASSRLNDPQRAIKLYTTVTQRDSERLSAWDALVDLYAKTNNNEELVKVLHQRAERTMDFMEKTAYLLREARIYREDFQDPEAAIRVYREALDIQEDNDEALEALTELYRETEDWESYISIQKQLIDVHPEREAELQKEIGRVYETILEDADKAIEAYEAVLTLNPTDEDVLESLQLLYGEKQNWAGLSDVFERLQETSTNDADRIMFLKRLGVLWEDAMGQPEKALSYWQSILLIDPLEDEALETSSRLLFQLGEWEELINLYEDTVSKAEDVQMKVDYLYKIADIYKEKLTDLDSAAVALSRIIEIDPVNYKAYERLVELYKELEYYNDQVKTLLAWKDQVDDPDEAAQLMVRAAEVLQENQDFDRAGDILWDAIRLNPQYDPAADALIGLYERTGEWNKVLDVYKRQLQFVAEDKKAELLAKLGSLYKDKFKDLQQAIISYEKALDLNPKLENVSLNLASLYVEQGQWPKAQALLEVLLGRLGEAEDSRKLAQIHFLIAQSDEHLGDTEKAYREYQQALKFNPDHIGASFGLAKIHYNKGRYQLAMDQYEALLAKGETNFEKEDVLKIYLKIADIAVKMDDLGKAKDALHKLLEEQPGNPKALEMLVEIAEKEGDWKGMVQYNHQLLEIKTDPYERFSILIEIGSIYDNKLNNLHGAIASFKKALEIDQRNKVALLRLFQVYVKGSNMQEAGMIEDAIGVLERLAEVEESREKRAKDYFRAAVLFKEQIKDEIKTLEYLEKALDEDPTLLKAFIMIEEILTRKRDWEAEVQAYTRMIERVEGQNPGLEFKLYFNLGEVYRSRLKDFKRAAEAYGKAAEINPDDVKTRLILADLFERMENRLDEAIEQHRILVQFAPLKKESIYSLRKMRELFLQSHQFDKALAISSLLIARDAGTDKEKEFYRDNMEPTLPYFQRSLDELAWTEHLFSKDQNPWMGSIFQILYEGMAKDLGPKDLKTLGLRGRNEISLNNDKMFFVRIYKAVTKALGTLAGKVYKDDTKFGMYVDFLLPPSLIIGRDMLSDKGPRELGFLLGRQLAYLHPAMFLPAVKSTRELKVYVVAALKLAKPDAPLARGADVVMQVVNLMERRLNAQRKELLIRAIKELLSSGIKDLPSAIEDYRKAMEKTALRAGTIVAGDAVAVFDVLRNEQQSTYLLSQHERLEEVTRFMVSQDYFLLRDSLGIVEEEPG